MNTTGTPMTTRSERNRQLAATVEAAQLRRHARDRTEAARRYRQTADDLDARGEPEPAAALRWNADRADEAADQYRRRARSLGPAGRDGHRHSHRCGRCWTAHRCSCLYADDEHRLCGRCHAQRSAETDRAS